MAYGGYVLRDPELYQTLNLPPSEAIYVRRRPKTKAEGRRISSWQEFLRNSGEFKNFMDEMSALYHQQYPGRQPLGQWQKFLKDHGMKELMDRLSAQYRGESVPKQLPPPATPKALPAPGAGIYSGGRRRYVRY
jgi:hypothetical protein